MRVAILLGLLTVSVALPNDLGLGAGAVNLDGAFNIGISAGQSTNDAGYGGQTYSYSGVSSDVGVGIDGGNLVSASSSSGHDDTRSYIGNDGTANTFVNRKSESAVAQAGLEVALGLGLGSVSKYVQSKRIIRPFGAEEGSGNGNFEGNNVQYHKNDFIEFSDDLSEPTESSSKSLSSDTRRISTSGFGSTNGNLGASIGNSNKSGYHIRHLTSESSNGSANKNIGANTLSLHKDSFSSINVDASMRASPALPSTSDVNRRDSEYRNSKGNNRLEPSFLDGHNSIYSAGSSSVSCGQSVICNTYGGSNHAASTKNLSTPLVGHNQRGGYSTNGSAGTRVSAVGSVKTFPTSGQLSSFDSSVLKDSHRADSSSMLKSGDKIIISSRTIGSSYSGYDGIHSASHTSSFSSSSSLSKKESLSNSQRSQYSPTSASSARSDHGNSGSTFSNAELGSLGGSTKFQDSPHSAGSQLPNESYKSSSGDRLSSYGGSSTSGGLSSTTLNRGNSDSTDFDSNVSNYASKHNSMGRLKESSGFAGTSDSKSDAGYLNGGNRNVALSSRNQHEARGSTTSAKLSGSKESKTDYNHSGLESVKLGSSTKDNYDYTKTTGSMGAGIARTGIVDLSSYTRKGSTGSRAAVELEAGLGLTELNSKELTSSFNSHNSEVSSGVSAARDKYNLPETSRESVEISLGPASLGPDYRSEIRPITSSIHVSKKSRVGVGLDLGITGSTNKQIKSTANNQISGVYSGIGTGVSLGLSGGNSKQSISTSSEQGTVTFGGIGVGIGLDIDASHGSSSSTTVNNVPAHSDASNFYSGSSSSVSSSSGDYGTSGSISFSKGEYDTKLSSSHPIIEDSSIVNHGSHHPSVLDHVGGLVGDVSSNLFGYVAGSSFKGSNVHTLNHKSGLLGGLLLGHSSLHSQASAAAGSLEGMYANSGHGGSFGSSLSAGTSASVGSSSSSGLLLGGLGLGIGLGR